MKRASQLAVALIVIALFLAGCPKPPTPPPPPPDPPEPPPVVEVTQATYVYEKDAGAVPPGVAAGLQQLNAAGVVATEFEEDTVDGTGHVPDQYAVALAEARKAGLPALVVQKLDGTVRVVKAPKTAKEVTDAAS